MSLTDTFTTVRQKSAHVPCLMTHFIPLCHARSDAIRHPAWQSNAWAFTFASRRWRLIHEGEKAGAPSARYSSSAVLYDHALWMYGGDDGGHKTSMFNYIFQAWFDEMWRFDLRAYSWQQVRSLGKPQPVKRALHSAVVIGDSMFMYGGLELADTWRYDFAKRSWSLLVPPPHDTDTKDASHPGRRHAFAAAASPSGMFIFGGCRHVRVPHRHPHASPRTEHACTLKHFESPHRKIPVWQVRGLRPLAFNDLWFFSTDSITWKRLPPTRDSDGMPQPVPAARSHLSLVSLTDSLLLLYGGALCIPGCSCYGDTWLYHARANTWAPVNATDPPTQCVCVTFSPSHARFPSKRHLRLPLPVSQPLPPECGRARARRCHLLIRRRVVPAIHVPQRSESPRATASHCTADDRLRRRTTPRSQRP